MDAWFKQVQDDELDCFQLNVIDPPANPQKYDKYQKIRELMGMENTTILRLPNMSDFEDRLDHALSLAPRARSF